MFGFLTLIQENPLVALLYGISVILAIALHEAAHAYTANYLGDDTPRLQGRLTLNPMAHLDLIGTLLIFVIGFGWGKPVQFNPYNLKNPKRDTALIAVAGPTTNIILAVISSLLLRLFGIQLPMLSLFLTSFISLNVVLAVFNMVPLDPLDGFKVVRGLLPAKYLPDWDATARYGMFVLLFLLLTGVLWKIMNPFINILLGILM